MSHNKLIERYFAACSEGTADDIAACFAADAVVYDTNHKPIRGGAEIGAFWCRTRERWDGARWYVDSCVSEGDAAAIEWTMTGMLDGARFTLRGSEHYRVTDARIAEIRQYWTFDRDRLDTALVDFPYAARRFEVA